MIPGGGACAPPLFVFFLTAACRADRSFCRAACPAFRASAFPCDLFTSQGFGNIVAGTAKNIHSLRHSERNEVEPKVLAGACLEILHCAKDTRTGRQTDRSGETKNHISGRKGLPEQNAYATMKNQRIVRIFYYLS